MIDGDETDTSIQRGERFSDDFFNTYFELFQIGGRMIGFFNHPAKIGHPRQTTIQITQARVQFKRRMRTHSLEMHILYWFLFGPTQQTVTHRHSRKPGAPLVTRSELFLPLVTKMSFFFRLVALYVPMAIETPKSHHLKTAPLLLCPVP